MRRAWMPLALVLFLWALCGCAGTYAAANDQDQEEFPPPPPGEVDVSYFYDALAPYGDWIWDDTYGWIWYPTDVPVDWVPYTDGQWIWTDDGWTWDSDWPWGWATFHYGRWFDHSDYGWCWVPGTEWAPAWCAWREGDGWIGWAPLPPDIVWRDQAGFDWDDWDHLPGIRHNWWSFCRDRDFVGPAIHRRLAPLPKAVTLVRVTRNATHYGFEGSHVVNRSIDPGTIRAAYGKQIPRYRLADAPQPPLQPGRRMQRDTVYVYRPKLAPAPKGRQPAVAMEPRAAPLGKPMPPNARGPAIDRSGPDQSLRQQQDLRKRQDAERQALQKEQQRELRQPPSGVSADQLRQQHLEEQRALEEQTAREQRVLQARREQGQQRGQQVQAPAGRGDRAAPVQKRAPVKDRKDERKDKEDQDKR